MIGQWPTVGAGGGVLVPAREEADAEYGVPSAEWVSSRTPGVLDFGDLSRAAPSGERCGNSARQCEHCRRSGVSRPWSAARNRPIARGQWAVGRRRTKPPGWIVKAEWWRAGVADGSPCAGALGAGNEAIAHDCGQPGECCPTFVRRRKPPRCARLHGVTWRCTVIGEIGGTKPLPGVVGSGQWAGLRGGDRSHCYLRETRGADQTHCSGAAAGPCSRMQYARAPAPNEANPAKWQDVDFV